MTRLRAVCRGLEATLAVASAVSSLIVIGVAGASLSQMDTSNKPSSESDKFIPPHIGRPAVIFAIVAACLSIFMSYATAVVRVLQIRMPGMACTNSVVVIVFSYLMMFLGSVIIAAFGAAGVLSAIAASNPSDKDHNAANYLIGTSVSSFVAFLIMICFMVQEMVVGLCTETKTGEYTEIQ